MLCRVGIDRDTAVDLIVSNHADRRRVHTSTSYHAVAR
jgi:hypothetical protein